MRHKSISAQDVAQFPIFADLTPRDRAEVANRMWSETRQVGDSLIDDRDIDEGYVYFILEGEVRVSRLALDGREVGYRTIAAGNSVGDFSAIDGEWRSADVKATKVCELAVIEGRQFVDILKNYPIVALAQLKNLTRGMRELSDRLFEQSSFIAEDRLKLELMRLAAKDSNSNMLVIEALPTQSELAVRINSQRETISRMLGQFESQGMIKRQKRRVVIPDVGRLELPALQNGFPDA